MEKEADDEGKINEVGRHVEVEVDEGMEAHEEYRDPCPGLDEVVAMPATLRPEASPLPHVG